LDLGLLGKTALVTGASDGIGAGIAKALYAEGCNLHMVSRSHSKLRSAAAGFAGRSDRVSLHSCDLSDSTQLNALIDETGVPDIVINNAGAIPAGDILDVDERSWRQAWDLKLFGYINLCRRAYRDMAARGAGVIVNVTGLAADRTDRNYIAGSSGNAALNALSRALGGSSLNDGVRVLAVSPGPVETGRLTALMRKRAEKEFGDPELWRRYLSNLPGGRAASIQEVADVVAFAVSARAAFLSGTVITVDGGHGGNHGSFT